MSKYLFNKKLWSGVNLQIYTHDDVKDIFVYGFELCWTFSMLIRFNATVLLERLRNKRLIFVGDSLNRGQWVSMVCLVDSAVPPTLKSMHTNGSLSTFKATVSNNICCQKKKRKCCRRALYTLCCGSGISGLAFLPIQPLRD